MGTNDGMDLTQEGNPLPLLPEAAPTPVPVLRARRAIVIAVAFFAAQIMVGIAVGIGAVVLAVLRHTAQGAAAANALKSAMLPSAIAGQLVGTYVAFRMTRRVLKGPAGDGGMESIGWRKGRTSDTALAVLAGGLISLLYLFVVVRVLPPSAGRPLGPLAAAANEAGWPRFFWAVLVLLFAPPTEEFVFRGILLEGLSNSFGAPAAAGIVTLAFVLVHVPEASAYRPALLAIGLLAGTALYFRLKTRSLLPAIGAHFGYNLGLAIFVYSR